MRRRALLSTAVTAFAAATAGCSGVLGGGGGGLSETTVKSIEAPGSAAGTVTIPADSVAVVDVFSTACSPCKTEIDRLRSAHSRLDGSVKFVSVTNQVFGGAFTKATLRNWWGKYGGEWTVAADTTGAVTRELGVQALPTVAVVRPDGSVPWQHEGVTSADALVNAVRQANG